jgi:RNA polymerase sigma-70 factor, ECF subfamily
MATPFPVDTSKHEDEVWAWLEPHFRQHRRQLYLFALGALGNREDAEDATQIALLNAHRALVRGERPTWPRAWLFAIALNVCRRLRRQASARHALVASTRELLSLQRGSDAPTGTEISQALSSLPPGQRKIFLLRELRGLSYAELSERLGLSLAATESLLARARRRLRQELAAPDVSTGLGSPRRRPLIGLPGAGALVRLARAPATFKLAGLACTAAVAPALVVGLHADQERSQPPGLRATASPVIQPVQQAFPRAVKRPASSPAPRAEWTPSRLPGALSVDARSLTPASADPAPVAEATAAANLETGAAEGMGQQLPPASAASLRVSGQPPAKSSETTHPVPTADATGDEAVDDALATTVDAAVDDLAAAVPAPAAAPDVTADAAPEGVVPDPSSVVPDPPPVVQDVLHVSSSPVSDALP